MLKSRRLIALLTAAVFVAAFVFSALFIVAESNHECRGNDCQVCEHINSCIGFLDNFSPKPNSAAFSASLFFAVVLCIGYALHCEKNKTPVDMKVKLSI